jgi:glucose-1-phosphatase
MQPTSFQNIIFDLGGVIINIEPERTWQAFAQRTGKNDSEIKALFSEMEVFAHLEEGKISGTDFINTLSQHTRLSEQEVLDCWNALLLDIPEERIELLKSLKKNHRLILLSNTNELHIDAIQTYLDKQFSTQLHDLFDEVFLSHEIQLRKPNREIYAHLLEATNIDPRHSVFIDDLKENALSATQVGISGLHLDLSQKKLVDLFK